MTNFISFFLFLSFFLSFCLSVCLSVCLSKLTNFMEQSPSWEAKTSFLALYRARRFITALYKSPSLLCILSQINPVHAPPSHVLKIHFNTILPPIPMFSKWSPSLRFPNHNPICTSSLPPIRLLHFPITSSLLDPNIFLSTLYSNIPQPLFLP